MVSALVLPWFLAPVPVKLPLPRMSRLSPAIRSVDVPVTVAAVVPSYTRLTPL